MFLKKIELSGFKSFASKTVFEFPDGITAVVGPNGSGKSNIIDAVRWLLGERDAKNLRGGKVEDLIFAGTPHRARMGMAQASIYFDNSSGFFPIEFNEVSIMRQVSGDGTSRYFLNKAEVRLKDITEFLAKSRLGSRGLIIIGQGNSDSFIKASPEERREMIEEILGLREYQIKKKEAERKLKNTTFNLEKARALIEEIKPHLSFLKRQTAKWEKSEDVRLELADLEAKFFSAKFSDIHTGLSKIDPLVHDLNKKIELASDEVISFEENLKNIEAQRPNQYKEVGEVRAFQAKLLEERSKTEKELGRLEARIELLLTPRQSGHSLNISSGKLLDLVLKIRRELESGLLYNEDKVKELFKNLISEIDGIIKKEESGPKEEPKELIDLRAEVNKFELVLREQNDELVKLRAKENELNAALESFTGDFKKAFAVLESKKEELNNLKNEKNRILFDKEKFEIKLRDLNEELRQLGKSLDEVKQNPVQIPEGFSLVDSERRMYRLRAELASVGEIDEAIIKEAQETEARHIFLINQSDDLAKAMVDLKNLISELDEKINGEFSSAIHKINEEFDKFFGLMFGGGKAKLKVKHYEMKVVNNEEGDGDVSTNDSSEDEEESTRIGVEIEVSLPRKKVSGLDMLSGGERSLVSLAALFALISVSPPPFLVLDEIDAALDERNARRFSEMLKEFSKKTQFVVVTHNRATMESADVLYGVTIDEDGSSKVLSLKFEGEKASA